MIVLIFLAVYRQVQMQLRLCSSCFSRSRKAVNKSASIGSPLNVKIIPMPPSPFGRSSCRTCRQDDLNFLLNQCGVNKFLITSHQSRLDLVERFGESTV